MAAVQRLARGLVACAAIAVGSVTAQAQVVDFQVGQAGTCYEDTCIAQGYSFSFIALGWGISDDANSNFNRTGLGSTGLLGLYGRRTYLSPFVTVTMTKVGGGAFNLSSFLSATAKANFAGPVTVSLLGDYAGGGTVSTSIVVDNTYASYSLTNFNDINKLTFTTENDEGFSLDNLNTGNSVSTVPEPSSVVLIASGLAALLFVRRRRAR